MRWTYPLWIVLGSLFLANAVVSLLVARTPYYSTFQKLVQCSIAWLLPVLGAVAIWAFLRTQEHGEVFDTRTYPERSKKGVAAEVQNAIHEASDQGRHVVLSSTCARPAALPLGLSEGQLDP